MASGDSRSIYVVQRTFTRVRRGYDPDEVDRHLRLVSEWFARSRVGEEARELEQRAAEAKGAQLEAEATLKGARLRAAAETAGAEAAPAAAPAPAVRPSGSWPRRRSRPPTCATTPAARVRRRAARRCSASRKAS